MRGLIFDAESVRAILAGTKSQTRRVVKPQPSGVRKSPFVPSGIEDLHGYEIRPRYRPGDVVYVRETFAYVWPDVYPVPERECNIEYKADTGDPYPGDWPAEYARGNPDAPRWRSPLHMPEWAARIKLEISHARVERLQEISTQDIFAEGTPGAWIRGEYDMSYRKNPNCFGQLRSKTAQHFYALRWDKINRKRAPWESNPWVFVYEFRRQP